MVFEVKYIKYTLFVYILLPHRRPHRLHSRELTVEFSQRREGSCSQANKMLNLAAAFRTAGGWRLHGQISPRQTSEDVPDFRVEICVRHAPPYYSIQNGTEQSCSAWYGIVRNILFTVCPKSLSKASFGIIHIIHIIHIIRTGSVFQSKDEPGGTEKARIVMAPLWVDLWKESSRILTGF